MIQVDSVGEQTVSRRTILAVATSAGIPIISGCNIGSNRLDDGDVSSKPDKPDSNELEDVQSSLEEIYREINRFPVSEDGEFIFDVQKFEEDFDYEVLLEETRKLQERIEKTGPEYEVELDALDSIARIAELRIRERVFTHQSIAAGLTYGRRLMQGEYADAAEAIRHGNGFLKELSETGGEIENELEERPGDTVSVDGFESNSIRISQLVLFEIVQWTTLSYRSFEYASVGFELFEDGAEKVDEERIDEARRVFERAGGQFTRANELLERAHGRGRRLGYVVPLVRKLRCVLPVYRDTCERFVDSFTAWRSGDEDRARRIGREVINEVDQRMAQCENSGAI